MAGPTEEEKLKAIVEPFLDLAKRTHFASALTNSAMLEEMLARLIQAHMPKLSNRQKEKLFQTRGPLASFSAKIDIAAAFDLISDDMRRQLHAVRDIRNAFAHTTDDLNFDSDDAVKLMAKLPEPKKVYTSNIHKFSRICEECAYSLVRQRQHRAIVNALMDRPDKQKASAEKSQKRPRRQKGRDLDHSGKEE